METRITDVRTDEAEAPRSPAQKRHICAAIAHRLGVVGLDRRKT